MFQGFPGQCKVEPELRDVHPFLFLLPPRRYVAWHLLVHLQILRAAVHVQPRPPPELECACPSFHRSCSLLSRKPWISLSLRPSFILDPRVDESQGFDTTSGSGLFPSQLSLDVHDWSWKKVWHLGNLRVRFDLDSDRFHDIHSDTGRKRHHCCHMEFSHFRFQFFRCPIYSHIVIISNQPEFTD